MDSNNMQFWQEKYLENSTGWDLGTISPPLKEYINQLQNKQLEILIPGAGNAYEAEYLHDLGFTKVFVADWAPSALQNLKNRVPDFPDDHLIMGDFFEINRQFDLILEQTFFCALTPNMRQRYVNKMHDLLKPKGKLTGLLFNVPLNTEHPPYGGCKDEYLELMKDKFHIKTMETSYNSIKPRQGSELFFIAEKK